MLAVSRGDQYDQMDGFAVYRIEIDPAFEMPMAKAMSLRI